MLPPIHKPQASASSSPNIPTKKLGNEYEISRHPSSVELRLQALEQQNAQFQHELVHLRHQLSNNHLQHDATASFLRLQEEFQRLTQAMASKTQADLLFQQREQQKAALLFAEVTRLSQSVDQLQSKAWMKQPVVRSSTELPELEEVQTTVQTLKHHVSQLRLELEAERNERWKQENERNAWVSDLRAALSKADAAVDAKIQTQLERLTSKMMNDRMELSRLMDEQRDMTAALDVKRLSAHMSEFAGVNDHLSALERWIQTEFGHLRRIVQFLLTETDSRSTALVSEVHLVWKSVREQLDIQEMMVQTQWDDMTHAMEDLATFFYRKVDELEQIVPLEVKARQKNDEKLKARMENILKSLSKAIERSNGMQEQAMNELSQRLEAVEHSQQTMVQHVQAQESTVKATIDGLLSQSDAMLSNWAAQLEPILTQRSARSEPETSSVEVATLASEITQTRSLIAGLHAHANECRQYCEYLTYAVEQWREETIVTKCMDDMIYQIEQIMK